VAYRLYPTLDFRLTAMSAVCRQAAT